MQCSNDQDSKQIRETGLLKGSNFFSRIIFITAHLFIVSTRMLLSLSLPPSPSISFYLAMCCILTITTTHSVSFYLYLSSYVLYPRYHYLSFPLLQSLSIKLCVVSSLSLPLPQLAVFELAFVTGTAGKDINSLAVELIVLELSLVAGTVGPGFNRSSNLRKRYPLRGRVQGR